MDSALYHTAKKAVNPDIQRDTRAACLKVLHMSPFILDSKPLEDLLTPEAIKKFEKTGIMTSGLYFNLTKLISRRKLILHHPTALHMAAVTETLNKKNSNKRRADFLDGSFSWSTADINDGTNEKELHHAYRELRKASEKIKLPRTVTLYLRKLAIHYKTLTPNITPKYSVNWQCKVDLRSIKLALDERIKKETRATHLTNSFTWLSHPFGREFWSLTKEELLTTGKLNGFAEAALLEILAFNSERDDTLKLKNLDSSALMVAATPANEYEQRAEALRQAFAWTSDKLNPELKKVYRHGGDFWMSFYEQLLAEEDNELATRRLQQHYASYINKGKSS